MKTNAVIKKGASGDSKVLVFDAYKVVSEHKIIVGEKDEFVDAEKRKRTMEWFLSILFFWKK